MILKTIKIDNDITIEIVINDTRGILFERIIPFHLDVYSTSDAVDKTPKKYSRVLTCNGGICYICPFRNSVGSCIDNLLVYISKDLKELAVTYPEYFI